MLVTNVSGPPSPRLMARTLNVHSSSQESLAALLLKAVDVLHANVMRTAAVGVVQDTEANLTSRILYSGDDEQQAVELLRKNDINVEAKVWRPKSD